jgi:SecD/SecF fusion protein
MEKQKRWQFYLIIAVILLTLYNILPTVFYYSKPLKAPINADRAHEVAHSIVERVDDLEGDAKSWLRSFSKLLGIKPASIEIRQDDPRMIDVVFNSSGEADLFKRFLPRAGALIPFVPSQLELNQSSNENNKVTVIRQIGVRLDLTQIDKLFTFTSKYDEKGNISPFYRELIYDRLTQLALAFGGPSKVAQQMIVVNENGSDQRYDDIVVTLNKEIVDVVQTLGEGSPITKRYFASLAQNSDLDADALIQKFLARSDSLKTRLVSQIETLTQEQKSLKEKGKALDTEQKQLLALLENQRNALVKGSALIQKHLTEIKNGGKPIERHAIEAELAKSASLIKDNKQSFSLEGHNPYVKGLIIDWDNDKIMAQFYPDVQEIRESEGTVESKAFVKEKLNQFVINDIARASRIADETLVPDGETFAVNLDKLTNPTSFLAFNLGYLAQIQTKQIEDQLLTQWIPQYTDLVRDVYPIHDYKTYRSLKPEEQKLGLVIYAPAMYSEAPPAGFRTGSIYVIAKGLDPIMQKYKQNPEASGSQAFVQDINQLSTLLQQSGFIGYPGSSYGMAPEFAKDFIFELDDYYSNLLKATREDFTVKGSKRYAVLDFTDVEQRILAWNKIQDKTQEDLLKWREEYNSAQVDLNASSRYQVPYPTKNAYWENFKLSLIKYFRGDDRKILKWGLDLSGGKTVRIGLRDQNGRPVTQPEDLNQAVNELYTRINKMGVSERTIRVEDKNIILDFPGSQGLSAAELVKASAMYFHIVNEKFTSGNATLKEAVNQFLQGVWNEAVVTNRKDIDSINEIAWQHLGGAGGEAGPQSDYAKMLYDQGLRLANPKDKLISHSFNDTLSSIGMMRGEDFSEWDNQTHPLIVIFHNYALEGSSLTNIQVGYDPTEGNILTFGIKSHYEGSQDRTGNPRDDFYAWTSQFSEDKIVGTPKEVYSQGRGWRMAVVLNGSIISKPALKAALRDGATISGRFSQREINQLAADLKAGSLSFTPRILSEQNVSPELGKEERTKGIVASVVALVLVVVAMIAYYHFAGLVASCAVLFNLLIMWGVLQNLDAALTLPGIAGIVLAIGMAVDANVLVFERVREEFKHSGRIASALQAGYRKAFSAIVDSNITTIIAALILIQFDSGPIKGFAVTLIIGILSSMFTALFMTRYFFAGWVQNPKNKALTMSQFIGQTSFDFLGQAKKAITLSLVIMSLGGVLFFSQIKTLFSMDFTGGYSLVVDLAEKAGHPNYRKEAADALLAHGATSNDFQIRELSRPNQLRIQFGMGMEEKGHPFYQMPENLTEGKYVHSYEHNPRIVWAVNALADGGLSIQKSQLDGLDRDWSAMSGQFSDAMRYNAVVGLAIALLSILVYITFRFEFKYAVGAVVGLAHDVIITLGILAFFHWVGFPVQIDLQVVGAIMTIIGYALNDTIIVFDRIREDVKLLRKMKFYDVVNHALNVTLARTIMTSGTTLLVLISLVLLGGKSIFAFSLVMLIGVIVGTLSSLFIASPVMLYIHNREIARQEMALRKEHG